MATREMSEMAEVALAAGALDQAAEAGGAAGTISCTDMDPSPNGEGGSDVPFASSDGPLLEGSIREESRSRLAGLMSRTMAVSVALSLATVLLLGAVGASSAKAPVVPVQQKARVAAEAVELYEQTGCVAGQLPQLWPAQQRGEVQEVKVLTYNLFWWNLFRQRNGNGDSAARLISHAGPFDMMGFQECEDLPRVLNSGEIAGIYSGFSGDGSPTSAVCMAYRKTEWYVLGNGFGYVAVDQLGRRAAQWMRLQRISDGQTVFFMNHHGPLPLNSGGRCGGPAVAYNLLNMISLNAVPGDAIIVVGDFNANGQSTTVQHMEWVLNKAYSGIMAGGIDNIFTNIDTSNIMQTQNLGKGGSDHDALSAGLRLGIQRPLWWPWPLPLSFVQFVR